MLIIQLRYSLALLCLCMMVSSWALDFPRRLVSFGMYRIDAEVAANTTQRAQGLMFRKTMAPQQGMLFIFDSDAKHCMWMQNTLIPLSVAFLDAQGKIINIEDMQPQTTESHCARKDARYALEMNAGWFKKYRIGPGAQLNELH